MNDNQHPVTSDIEQWIVDRATADSGKTAANSAADAPVFSVVIPAYNEQFRLPTTLIEIIDYFDSNAGSYEVIVVDDGSRDDTAGVVRKFQKIRQQLRLVALPQNRGKGCAVRTGVLVARGKYLLFADADGSTPIRELSRLKSAIDAEADVAIGSRAMHSEETKVVRSWYRKIPGRLFNFCVKTFILPGISDTQCGFKMFSAQAARFIFSHQKSDGFSFDVELLFIARRAGMKVSEVPVNWTNVPGSKVNMLVDATKMLRDIFIFRLRHRGVSPRNWSQSRAQEQA